jgi:RNA-binding protein 26
MMGAPMRFGGPSGPQGGFQGMHGMQGMQGQQFGMPPQQQQQQQQQGGPWGPGPMQQQGMPHPGAFGAAGPSLGSRMGPQGQQQPGFQGGPPHDGQFHGMSGPSRGGHAAGRGAHNATPRGAFRGARSQTALVLENVPAEHLELIKINEYFKRFGTITNIQIDAPGQKALVDFARPEEAKAAHGCPDAVFGNRFVRIFFQRLEDAENGGISTPLDKPGAPHQSRPIAKKPAFVPGQTNVYHAPGAPTTAASRAKVELDRKQAQSQLDHLLGEQKTLMASVTSSSITPDARKATMMRLRALPAEIGAATDKVKEAVQAIANMPAAPAPLSTEERNALKERRERERLDRELEMHGKGDETTDELKAKLESLKAEVSTLGAQDIATGSDASFRLRHWAWTPTALPPRTAGLRGAVAHVARASAAATTTAAAEAALRACVWTTEPRGSS